MIRRLLSDRRAASAAEFALVLPVLIILLFGVIDGGRWLWTYNRIEKATQMGARFAAVSNFAATAVGASYVDTTCGGTTILQGDPIPANCFTAISCTSTSSSSTCDSTAFNNIVNRMRLFAGEIGAANVTVQYAPSGLGFAGNPFGPDVSPLVRVSVSGMQFRPLSFLTFKQTGISMPTFTAALTAEDLTGSQSN